MTSLKSEAEQRLFILTKLSNPWWRLNHLYKVQNEKGELVTFRMRPAQRQLFRNMHNKNIILKARQLGFSTAIDIYLLDKARSDAYAEQIKAGLSWVEVRRNNDPFGPKFKVSTVNRNEVFWDWLSREADLSDCRWLMRRRWMDTDEAKVSFPGMSQIIDYAVHEWRGFVDTTLAEGQDSQLLSAWEEYQSWSREQSEWLQSDRRRVLLQVVYYRVYQRMPVIELNNGRVVAFDKNNLMQAVAVATGRVQVTVGKVSRIREAWFVGPHFITDRLCAAPQGMFPLVPFWGFRKDKTGEPYGLISRAIPAQDEVNFRRLKLTWQLQAIALAPVQQTPAFKAQLAQRMSEVIQGLPPEVQAAVLDLWVNLLDVPDKQEFVERIRTALGTPKSPDEMTPEEQQQAQQQQEIQQQQMELQMREMAGKVAKLEADAARAQAAAHKDAATAQLDTAKAQGQRYVDAFNQAQAAEILTGIQNSEQESALLQQQILQTLQQRIEAMPL